MGKPTGFIEYLRELPADILPHRREDQASDPHEQQAKGDGPIDKIPQIAFGDHQGAHEGLFHEGADDQGRARERGAGGTPAVLCPVPCVLRPMV